MGIIETLNTFVLGSGASGGSCNASTVRVDLTDGAGRKAIGISTNITVIGITFSLLCHFRSSPLSDRAVRIGSTFHTATSFDLTVWVASIITAVGINGAEINADTSESVAVLVPGGSARRTIKISTGVCGRRSPCSAIVT